MYKQIWCEHVEKIAKYITVEYHFESETKKLRIQSWLCPECGVHGANSEIIVPITINR
ncbi:hypothetical protein [Pelosinus propionicus]|uniref:Uncharacterized protein n=1 Tax=Pelosinus propionicus DSM 13327 TaxID=1123291 RepID=A0A1I4HCS4_9FIRM|nr:hypothetical protein [Pelosinus propionicus]SFL39407.1 hypothetical protein SAMN04490355_1003100 [Pelosinus propionicus DSM 13327]